ncbi:hypothetical protein AXG55_00830 [Silvanigrella aquatica]|uniref:Uncharacterized protein n=1 Tax=Silvanigrella aquatica TaxID=1915309 RepID=A0A1L4CX75_9BACT|nr:hypothetical protein AXG55_00830 [Silvanigrella aquatica]
MIYFEIISLSFVSFHAFLMIIDEFIFHRKRVLPKWERVGHPIDSLFFLICFFIVLFFPMNMNSILFFTLFACISCFIIIKDEGVHLKYCSKYEQYIHALLFVLHPIILIILFLSWSSFSVSYFPIFEVFKSFFLKLLIYFQFFSATIFLFYQIVFWNFIFKEAEYVSKRSHK